MKNPGWSLSESVGKRLHMLSDVNTSNVGVSMSPFFIFIQGNLGAQSSQCMRKGKCMYFYRAEE
jgi:hypothetical protein